MTVSRIAFPVLAGLAFTVLGCCIVFNVAGLADRINAGRHRNLPGHSPLRFLVNVKIQGGVWMLLGSGLVTACFLAYAGVLELAG
ncbi:MULTISPECIES: hypothetical protein [Streptomyces]|uniref:Uncharacterized protein n=1 Tax=Streptomyces cheonanensis TaxID=312720 RepID=A0ABN2VA27_9ACTN|nr:MULTISPECIES: hypothetical protein [Streptomyces]